jgi:hypothetical protein
MELTSTSVDSFQSYNSSSISLVFMSAWESVRVGRTDLQYSRLRGKKLPSSFSPLRFETDDLPADKIITAVLYISKNETLIVTIKMLPTYTQGALLF